MFYFTITDKNGNVLRISSKLEKLAKLYKQQYSKLFEENKIKGFSIKQNGNLIYSLFRN